MAYDRLIGSVVVYAEAVTDWPGGCSKSYAKRFAPVCAPATRSAFTGPAARKALRLMAGTAELLDDGTLEIEPEPRRKASRPSLYPLSNASVIGIASSMLRFCAACRISRCPAKAARRATCRSIRGPTVLSRTTSTPQGMASTIAERCSGRSARGLQVGAGLFGAARVRDRRSCVARDRRHQRARSPGRHRQGARVARPRQYCHHADLRSPSHAARG